MSTRFRFPSFARVSQADRATAEEIDGFDAARGAVKAHAVSSTF